jgi:hypothetical protein
MEAKAILNLCQTRGFDTFRTEADRELTCITNDVLPAALNVAKADDHVHEVERSIRTIKERVRCTVQGQPCQRVPKIMVRATVEEAHKDPNQFPAKDGTSDAMSLPTMMTGMPSPDCNNFKIKSGAHAQVFEDKGSNHSDLDWQRPRWVLSHVFNHGRKTSRQQWTELPIPDGLTAAIKAMATKENQPLMGNGVRAFKWSTGIAFSASRKMRSKIGQFRKLRRQLLATRSKHHACTARCSRGFHDQWFQRRGPKSHIGFHCEADDSKS